MVLGRPLRSIVSLFIAASALYACTASLQGPDGDDADETDDTSNVDDSASSGGNSPTANAGASGSEDPETPHFVPCEVQLVLAQSCDTCHGARNIALPSLITWAQISAESERIREAVLGTGPSPMPPQPFSQLSEEARATLLDWIDAGTPSLEEKPTCP